MRALLTLLVLYISCSYVTSEYVTGTVSSPSQSFLFLGKFVFDYNPTQGAAAGQFTLELDVPLDQQNGLKVALYDDQPESWPSVFNTDVPCLDKFNSTGENDKNPSKATYLTKFEPNSTTFTITTFITQRFRPRYWFFVVGSCAPTTVNYKLHMVNSQRSDWNAEFGTNVMGLNTLYLIYFLVYVIFLGVHLYGVRTLAQRQKYVHPLVKLFLGTLLVQFISVTCYLIHYGNFAQNGVGFIFLARIGEVAEVISRLIFIFLLMLLAKGWTISNEELTHKSVVVGVVITFAIIHIGIIVWKYAVDDPTRTSLSGGILVFNHLLTAVWFLFAIWFLYTILNSWRKEDNPSKASLYLKLAVVYGIWFILPPLVTVLSNFMDDWAREKLIQSLTLSITTIAYFVLSYLMWPTRAEEYFAISTPDVMLGIGGHDNYNQL